GDMGFYGPGGRREQWLTYRDKLTFQNMVKGGPLYPLNSFMNQGIAHAIWGTANLPVNAEEFAHEVHSFFAIGTSLQELYISPSRMTDQMWDILAEGAKWSRNNSDVLVDTHWVGGDPAEGKIYGWAAWSKRKGILSLRNPHDKSGKVTIDIGKVFELPTGAAQKYSLKSPWKKDKNRAAIVLSAGTEYTFEMEPFEVMVFDAMPL
ncbi:MAG: enterotoxin, partial [Planctomycetota bacterium]